jgi:hypothetical protein
VKQAKIDKISVLRAYQWDPCTCDGKVTIRWATMQLTSCLVGYTLVPEPARPRRRDNGRDFYGSDFWSIVERAMPGYLGRMRCFGHDLLPPGVA